MFSRENINFDLLTGFFESIGQANRLFIIPNVVSIADTLSPTLMKTGFLNLSSSMASPVFKGAPSNIHAAIVLGEVGAFPQDGFH